MDGDRAELRLVIEPADDVDVAELDEMTRSLRDEVLDLPVDDVTSPVEGVLPDGAKALDPVTIGTLLVTMSGAGGLLVSVMDTIRSWIERRGGQRVVIEIAGNSLELSRASAQEREQLLVAFLAASGSPAAPTAADAPAAPPDGR